MLASIGDRIIVESGATGRSRRDGEVMAVRHENGTPPYEVCWSDTGKTSLIFPGPDSRVEHFAHPNAADAVKR
jgi:hypothetical protein